MANVSEVKDRDRFDIVVYGASGYTGQFVVEHVAKEAQKDSRLKWAISGRSETKLQHVLKQAGEFLETDLSAVPTIVADVSNEESLVSMAKQAKVVLNCVGPYRMYGPPVVKACVENGASHVDISGEPQFLERMQIDYHKLAEEKGVYVVGACGFDSIPADMGVVYLREKFQGEVNSAESFLRVGGKDQKGATINIGTWNSLIHGVSNWKETKQVRKELFPQRLPKPDFPLKKRFPVHYSEFVKAWCLPFLGSDRSCVARSQRFFYEHEQRRPIQLGAYIQFESLFGALITFMGMIFIALTSQFSFGKRLLLNYPGLFTFGKVGTKELGREENEKNFFVMTIHGDGWGEKLAEPTDTYAEPPNKSITVQVKGKNIGYGATCVCMVQAALCILYEPEKMPGIGGVYAPAAAFSKTTLIKRLHANGVTFEVLE